MEIGTKTLSVSNGDAHLPYNGTGTKIFASMRTRAISSFGYAVLINVTKKENGFLFLVGGFGGSGLSINVNGSIDIDYMICK